VVIASWGLVPIGAGPGAALLQRWHLAPTWAVALGWVIGLAPALLLSVRMGRPTQRTRAPLLSATLTLIAGFALWAIGPSPLNAYLTVTTLLLMWAAFAGWFERVRLKPSPAPNPAFAALAGALLAWLAALNGPVGGPATRVALAGALITAGFHVQASAQRTPALRWLALPVLVLIPHTTPGVLALPALLWLVIESLRQRSEGDAFSALLLHPVRAFVATFTIGGFMGASLLALPAATESGTPIAFIDAVFTAFSAICVTGLAVLDTPATFSAFGEGVILTLIQTGGLGVMTFSTAALVFFGERLSLKHERAAATLLGSPDRSTLKRMLRTVFGVTFAIEAAGALLLTLTFWLRGEAAAGALWRGTFTAISAFCNAGFALQSDSLVPFQTAPGILWSVAALITLGGLSPVLILRVARRRRLGIQARMVLWTSAALTVGGFVLIAGAEWQNTLAHLGWFDKITNALFQSVTLRTAGFNSIDLAAITPASFSVMVPLMFIGGSPGSTAGGIKTTTLAVVVLLVRSSVLGADRVRLGPWVLRRADVNQAAAVATFGVLTVFAMLMALALTQHIDFGPLLFEVVSAVGTVGLSVGATGDLDGIGKGLVSLAMLAGRVGPLSLLLILIRNQRPGPVIHRPEVQIDVG
jgi:trk system potassium uptake protein TrkH